MIIKTTILEFFPPYSSFTEIIMACLPLWSYFKNKNKQKKTEKKTQIWAQNSHSVKLGE